jgi:hypothetical protein
MVSQKRYGISVSYPTTLRFYVLCIEERLDVRLSAVRVPIVDLLPMKLEIRSIQAEYGSSGIKAYYVSSLACPLAGSRGNPIPELQRGPWSFDVRGI